MDFSSFLTSLGTSFVLFLVLMFLFTWLSRKPGNHVVYYPNRLLKGLEPYEGIRLTRNPFAWIREAVSSTEADVIRFSGVDTAVYFVYLTTGNLFVCFFLLALSASDMLHLVGVCVCVCVQMDDSGCSWGEAPFSELWLIDSSGMTSLIP